MDKTETFSVEDAKAAAERNELRAWVVDFLSSPGSDNADLAAMLKDDMAHWAGPMRLPFDELNRLAGPPDQPTLGRLDEDDLETVEGMEESIEDGWRPAPLIVSYRNGQLKAEDGNHRIEGLRRAGENDWWSIVCFENAAQHEQFMAERNA